MDPKNEPLNCMICDNPIPKRSGYIDVVEEPFWASVKAQYQGLNFAELCHRIHPAMPHFLSRVILQYTIQNSPDNLDEMPEVPRASALLEQILQEREHPQVYVFTHASAGEDCDLVTYKIPIASIQGVYMVQTWTNHMRQKDSFNPNGWNYVMRQLLGEQWGAEPIILNRHLLN